MSRTGGWRRGVPWRLLRNAIQIAFALYLLYLGVQFYLFVRHFATGGLAPYVPRPAAVEGFLPLSALVALKAWLATGFRDPVHPAALSIFLIIVLVSLVFKKGFCSWLCPVGTAVEGLARVGERLWGRIPSLPAWLDYPLRALKYLALFFFVQVILVAMPGPAAVHFLFTPYNRVADVKMLYFFTDPSPKALAALLALAALSLALPYCWCRYLCPYGALLGLASYLSPWRLVRCEERCSGCRRCEQACPGRLAVASGREVRSAECSACLNCLERCPRPGALSLTLPGGRRVGPGAFALALLAAFFGLILLAQASGHWQTALTLADYARLIPQAPALGHP